MTATWMLVCAAIFSLLLSAISGQSLTFNVSQNERNVLTFSLSGNNLLTFYGYLCNLTKSVEVEPNQILHPYNGNSSTYSGVAYFDCYYIENAMQNYTAIKCINQNENGTFDISNRPEKCDSLYSEGESCNQQPIGLVWNGNYEYSLISSDDNFLLVSNCSHVQQPKTTEMAIGAPAPPSAITSSTTSTSTRVEEETTSESNGDDEDDNLLIIIIAVAVSLVVLAVIIIGIILLVRRRKKQKLKSPTETSRQNNNGNAKRKKPDYENELGEGSPPISPYNHDNPGFTDDGTYNSIDSRDTPAMNSPNKNPVTKNQNPNTKVYLEPPSESLTEDFGYASTEQFETRLQEVKPDQVVPHSYGDNGDVYALPDKTKSGSKDSPPLHKTLNFDSAPIAVIGHNVEGDVYTVPDKTKSRSKDSQPLHKTVSFDSAPNAVTGHSADENSIEICQYAEVNKPATKPAVTPVNKPPIKPKPKPPPKLSPSVTQSIIPSDPPSVPFETPDTTVRFEDETGSPDTNEDKETLQSVYSKLGETERNFRNPYNVNLDSDED